MPSIIALISGITATGIVFTGLLTSIGLFARARKEQARLLVWEGFILLCLGLFYLGTVVSFFLLIGTGTNIEPGYRGAQLCYTIAPIGSAICMYTGFTMLGKERFAKPIAVIMVLTGVLYWYGLYFQPELTISAVIPDEVGGGLVDFELLSYVQVLTATYLVSLLAVIGGGFFWFAKQTAGEMRKRTLYIAIGCCFFTISGAVDSLMELAYFIFIPRFIMITGALLLYKGFLSGVKEAKDRVAPVVVEQMPLKATLDMKAIASPMTTAWKSSERPILVEEEGPTTRGLTKPPKRPGETEEKEEEKNIVL